uniref:Uncharacterized protein n=1 Tax=Romanomermis culicivorax TaxID=13658 RepID=A0A915HJP4_ROMCU
MTPKHADNVLKAAVALHNYLLMTDFQQPAQQKYCAKDFVDHEAFDDSLIEGDWRIIWRVRENLKNYFVSEMDHIPWQDKIVYICLYLPVDSSDVEI